MLWAPERNLYREQVRAWLSDKLPAGQCAVMVLMFGLDGGGPRTYREVAGLLHISTMNVKRKRRAAVDALRQYPEFRDMLRFAAPSEAVGGRPHGTSHE